MSFEPRDYLRHILDETTFLIEASQELDFERYRSDGLLHGVWQSRNEGLLALSELDLGNRIPIAWAKALALKQVILSVHTPVLFHEEVHQPSCVVPHFIARLHPTGCKMPVEVVPGPSLHGSSARSTRNWHQLHKEEIDDPIVIESEGPRVRPTARVDHLQTQLGVWTCRQHLNTGIAQTLLNDGSELIVR
jgi:hypothetical protein